MFKTKVRLPARIVLAAAVLLGVVGLPQTAGAAENPDRVLDISFPSVRGSRFTNDYHAARSGGARRHCATDIIGSKHQPIYAARGGRITSMPTSKPSYGYTINIAGDDGRRYSYLHLNDDFHGQQADNAGPDLAYAPGLRVGSTVRRGQHIGYMGDSGNAEGGVDHLHFEIHDPNVDNPACTNGGGADRANPYFSLTNAVAHNDFGGTPAPPPPGPPARGIDLACPASKVSTTPFPDVSGTHARAIGCVRLWDITSGGADGTFRPHDGMKREQLATLVVRLFESLGRPLPAATRDHFADDGNSVHHDNINRLADAGIVGGTAAGRFSPGEAVSRAQMATVLHRTYQRATGRALPGAGNEFDDDDGMVHEDDINRLAAARIATGVNSISFEPRRNVSRGEMAAFLSRTLDLLVEQRAASMPK